MTTTGLDKAYSDELVRRQDALQAEASRVIVDLDLMSALARAGRAEQVGSVVSGLMVWRDIDLGVVSPGLGVSEAWNIMRPVVARTGITRVSYTNESGHLNKSGRPYDDRHYFVIHYESTAHDDWKIDITFWLTDGPRGQRARALAMTELPLETRLRILWLKDVWHRLPVYPYQVGGTDIYDAVLEHGVRTPEEFDGYLRERGLPPRSNEMARPE
jgi:hypothetical protein